MSSNLYKFVRKGLGYKLEVEIDPQDLNKADVILTDILGDEAFVRLPREGLAEFMYTLGQAYNEMEFKNDEDDERSGYTS